MNKFHCECKGNGVCGCGDEQISLGLVNSHIPLLEEILGCSCRPNTPSCPSFAPQV